MADNIYAGLFTSPDQIRQKRLDDLAKQQMMVSGSGGSWDQLLGQVAASGNLMANQLTEGVAGMFGMKTKEEANAAKVQEMAKAIDWNAPEDLNQFAMALNDMGMTKQAVQVLQQRQSVLNQQAADEDRATKIAQGPAPHVEEKTVWIPRTTSKGKPVLDDNGDPVFEPKTIKTYYDWNNTTKKWEKRGDAATASEGGDMKIHDEASFNEYLMKRYQGGQP